MNGTSLLRNREAHASAPSAAHRAVDRIILARESGDAAASLIIQGEYGAAITQLQTAGDNIRKAQRLIANAIAREVHA